MSRRSVATQDSYRRSKVMFSSDPPSESQFYAYTSTRIQTHARIPPKEAIGCPDPCDTCVIMLEGPPAEDMMYENDLIGLSPSK